MNRHLRHLHELAVVARDTAPVNGARLAAAVAIGNKIIAYGKNSYKTHPMQKRFNRGPVTVEPTRESKVVRLGFTPPMEAICGHAEIIAIANAIRYLESRDLSSAILYVARVKYSDRTKREITWGNAKPCKICSGAIDAFGIKKVFYTCEGIDNYDQR